jgi:hypothetical protein
MNQHEHDKPLLVSSAAFVMQRHKHTRPSNSTIFSGCNDDICSHLLHITAQMKLPHTSQAHTHPLGVPSSPWGCHARRRARRSNHHPHKPCINPLQTSPAITLHSSHFPTHRLSPTDCGPNPNTLETFFIHASPQLHPLQPTKVLDSTAPATLLTAP